MIVMATMFVVNTILATLLVTRTVRKRRDLDTSLPGLGGIVQWLGAGAFVWQYCAIIESVAYLWIPLPPASLPYWSGIGAACLFVFGIAWWLTQRAFPASRSQTALNSMAGLALVFGSLQTTDSLHKAAPTNWTPGLLIASAGLLTLEAGLILLQSYQREKAARRADIAQRAQE